MKKQVTEADYQKYFQLKRLATQRFEAFMEDLECILISDGSEQCPKCSTPFEGHQSFCGGCRENLRPLMLVCPDCHEAHHFSPSALEDYNCCVFCGTSPWEPVKVSEFSGEIQFPGQV